MELKQMARTLHPGPIMLPPQGVCSNVRVQSCSGCSEASCCRQICRRALNQELFPGLAEKLDYLLCGL